MLRRRLTYALVLLCAVLFQIFFTGYLATFLLVLCLVLPLFSVLISLPVMVGSSIQLFPQHPAVERGVPCPWMVSVRPGLRLPLARISYSLREDNLLTGSHTTLRQVLSGASEGEILTDMADTQHCGLLTYTLIRPRICDLLGLFVLRPKAPPPAQLLVLPHFVEPEALPPLPREAREKSGLRPRPGGGPGEDYDLRSYRPGDPLRTVHWKLSSKWDDLVVRETLEEQQSALVLTFDHFGSPQALDTLFDRLFALSRLLLGEGRPHYIQWANPDTGVVQSCLVDSHRSLTACLTRIFSTPAPLTGHSILDQAVQVEGAEGPALRYHIFQGSKNPSQ